MSMNNDYKHIVDKVFIEVDTSNEKNAHQIKDGISTFLNSEIFPSLEKLLDKYDINGQTFRFDRLDVNFTLSDWNNVDEFKFEFLNKIEQKISEAIPSTITESHQEDYKIENKTELNTPLKQIVDQQQNSQKTFLFFLQNGFLPWFGREEYITELTSPKQWLKNLKQTQFLFSLQKLFQDNGRALERFILQFSNEQILWFIDALEIIQIKNQSELLSFINDLAFDSRKSFLKLIIKIGLDNIENRREYIEFVQLQLFEKITHEITEDLVVNWNHDFLSGVQHCFAKEIKSKYFRLSNEEIQTIVNDSKSELIGAQEEVGLETFGGSILESKPTIISKEFDATKTKKEPPFFELDKNEIVVRNAGLVLFHPFLKVLFIRFGWINKEGEILEEHRLKAVQTLHYCATGNENYFEGNLMFEKFLCNVPLSMPIPSESLIDEPIKSEADEMAKALLTNWQVLKNTSLEALREAFIQRNGKLEKTDNGFRLIVERKAMDILLDKLPWNLSIVKLPWKEYLLFVEWQTHENKG